MRPMNTYPNGENLLVKGQITSRNSRNIARIISFKTHTS